MIISKSLRMKIEAKIKQLKKTLENQKIHVNDYEEGSVMPISVRGGGTSWLELSPAEQKNIKKSGIRATEENIELLEKVLRGEIDISKKAISDKKLRISAIKKEKEVLETEIETVNRINSVLSNS